MADPQELRMIPCSNKDTHLTAGVERVSCRSACFQDIVEPGPVGGCDVACFEGHGFFLPRCDFFYQTLNPWSLRR